MVLIWVPQTIANEKMGYTIYSDFQFRTLDTIQGLVPICIHVDGAEFYANSEVLVWSMQSVFSSGQHVWDSKYPLVVIPHEMIRDADIKQQVQEVIAQVLKWSFRHCAEGVWPSTGPFGEALPSGHRSCQKGKPLAGGAYRACYFAFRADGKGRKEAHMFPRSYLHSFICEACHAQKEHKNWSSALSYKNFYQSAAYRLTTISSTLSCFSKVSNGEWLESAILIPIHILTAQATRTTSTMTVLYRHGGSSTDGTLGRAFTIRCMYCTWEHAGTYMRVLWGSGCEMAITEKGP